MPTTENTGNKMLRGDIFLYFIQSVAIFFIAIFSMSLRYGKLDFSLVFSAELGIRFLGSLCIWFANIFILERILQRKIDNNTVTQYLPLELTAASLVVTSSIYLVFYPLFIYLDILTFEFSKFLQGLLGTCGLSLLIVILYASTQAWKSWWSDGNFLFQRPGSSRAASVQNAITVKHSNGITKYDLKEISYFISEAKITFLVDAAGKKWITQYNLSELEEMVGVQFFRLNRRILVNCKYVQQVKKLPNHRLLVTISSGDASRSETISRYKSTRFKQWLEESS